MRSAIDLRDELLLVLNQEKENSMENLRSIEKGNQNSWMAGAYQGEIDAYNFMIEWLSQEIFEVKND